VSLGTEVIGAKGVSKVYASGTGLQPTDFAVAAGEIVAVVGENGAGKSTLSKILTGAVRPDTGGISVDGAEVQFRSPREALAKGVALIPQELAVVPEMSAAENILLGRWPGPGGTTSPAAIMREAEGAVERFGLPVDLRARMARLPLADRQIVELLKALTRGSRLLILDEPTAALSGEESGRLFSVLKRLASHGVAIVFVSHRLDEVLRHAGRIDVFRNGRKVSSERADATSEARVIGLMLGQTSLNRTLGAVPGVVGEAVLTATGWSSPPPAVLDGIDFEARRGEVVGIYGLRGSGAELIAEGLAGRRPRIRGAISIEGREVRMFRTPAQSQREGIAAVPAERKTEGLILGMSIRENLVLPVLRLVTRFGLYKQRRAEAMSAEAMSRFDIRGESSAQAVGSLSGGNQQKVLLASWLTRRPKVLLLQEPTRGVDVGARLEIHRHLRKLAESGTSVIVFTSDVEEAVAVSDRMLVMREGRIAAELAREKKTQEAAVSVAAGEAEA
jgi:ribose transport system ATP-binding protein